MFQGATCNAYFDFCSNWRLCQVVFCPQIHPHARVVRSLFVHGRGILERNSIFRSDFALLYAQEISTRRPLFAQGWTLAGPFVHRGPDGLSGWVVDHQGRQADLNSIPGNYFFSKNENMKIKFRKRNEGIWKVKIGVLSPKLFWPTARKKNSSDLRKNFDIRGWICKIFEITRTIYSNSERSEQLVTECFFNLFPEVSQTW